MSFLRLWIDQQGEWLGRALHAETVGQWCAMWGRAGLEFSCPLPAPGIHVPALPELGLHPLPGCMSP